MAEGQGRIDVIREEEDAKGGRSYDAVFDHRLGCGCRNSSVAEDGRCDGNFNGAVEIDRVGAVGLEAEWGNAEAEAVLGGQFYLRNGHVEREVVFEWNVAEKQKDHTS